MPLLMAILVLAADQLTKQVITNQLGPDEASHRYDVVGTFLALQYGENTGVAFGLLRGQTVLVTILALIVIGFLVRMYRHARSASPVLAIGCGLILGGAAGNLVDRARLGYVVDFVAVSAWPKFNVADSAITVGAFMLAWTYLRHNDDQRPARRDDVTSAGPSMAIFSRESER